MRAQEPKRDSFVMSDLWVGLWKTWWQSLKPSPLPMAPWPTPGQAAFEAWAEYWTDAWQRSVLYWDVMRKRGNLALEHQQKGKPPVLSFPWRSLRSGCGRTAGQYLPTTRPWPWRRPCPSRLRTG